MQYPLNGQQRIHVVMDALTVTLQQMVFRCTKGSQISPRYRIAMFAYSDKVYDLLGGVMTIDQVANLGVPVLSTMRATDTEQAFWKWKSCCSGNCPCWATALLRWSAI